MEGSLSINGCLVELGFDLGWISDGARRLLPNNHNKEYEMVATSAVTAIRSIML